MFNFSPRKFKDIRSYPDTWSVGKGTLEGKLIFTRFREGLKEAVGHPEYPFQIGIAVPLLHPTEDGLPTNSEAQELGKIEDALNDKIAIDGSGIFVLIITYNGMREFVFYTKEWKPESFEQEVKSINADPHKLQFMMQHDPKWDAIKRFVK
ncbi:MAG TPA: DUF695 domain-containing protein [Terriglobales bacterium]|jgi:hypothetical protein|nr:DUF695 domain-containing protein [Terriglobales bacterium]